MRGFLILSVIVIAVKHARCKIELKRDKEVIIDIDSPELHQSQYHTADFNTSAYNYGYAVEPNGQFHHETRGGDGVTYGCYGYIDSDDLLKVTHYVADSQGYRTLEYEKPVLVYPIDENAVDTFEKPYKPKGIMLDWKDLYFPIGCGMAKGGVILNAPVIRAPDGLFEQLGETKFPVKPSTEPKVVAPRLPNNFEIKTAPTKLTPVNGNDFGPHVSFQFQPKVTTSLPLPSTQHVSPSANTPQRTTNIPKTSINTLSNIERHNGPEYSNRYSNDHTVQQTSIPASIQNHFADVSAPFREPVTVTTRRPTNAIESNTFSSSHLPISSIGVTESHLPSTEGLLPTFSTKVFPDRQATVNVPIKSVNTEGLLPTFSTKVFPDRQATVNVPIKSVNTEGLLPTFSTKVFPDRQATVNVPIKSVNTEGLLPTFSTKVFPDRQATVNVPIKSVYTEGLLPTFSTKAFPNRQTTVNEPIKSVNTDEDFINSYTRIHPGSSTTPQPDYKSGEIPTTATIRDNAFTNGNSAIPAFSVFTPATTFVSNENINPFSTIRPIKFDGFNSNIPAKTEPSTEVTTEPYLESSTLLTVDSATSRFDENTPYAKLQTAKTTYQTPNKLSTNLHEPPAIGLFFSTKSSQSQHSYVESSTLPGTTLPGFETSTPVSQSTYPGIGEYKKPQFEFNIPTRAPIPVSTGNIEDSFVTINKGPINNSERLGGLFPVNKKESSLDNLEKITNGPHGAEYRLDSGISHSPLSTKQEQNQNYQNRNPVKQSRKEINEEERRVSLLTPLTHLSFSGTYPSKEEIEVTETKKSSIAPVQNFSEKPTNRNPSIFETHNSIHGFESSPQVVVPVRQSTTEPERKTNPQTQESFLLPTSQKNGASPGLITHMNAISQMRFQSNIATPTLSPFTASNQGNGLPSNPQTNYFETVDTHTRQPEISTSTDTPPFLYTRPHTKNPFGTYRIESSPLSSDSGTNAPNDDVNLYSGSFGERIQPGSNPATSSFTAYNRASTAKPTVVQKSSSSVQENNYKPSTDNDNFSLNYQKPKFVEKQPVLPSGSINVESIPNFNGYFEVENQNGNFYPNLNKQKSFDENKNLNNEIQPENKFVNTKKEFFPPYNPNSTPIPGSLGTAIGVYPPNLDELTADIPNFSIAISKWPFYIVPFPFANGNIMSFPFINGMPFPLGNGNNIPLANTNNENVVNVNPFNGGAVPGQQPVQSICSWLSSFIKPQENATNVESTTDTNAKSETLQISNLQVNLKNPQLTLNQNTIPYGIVGFIPIIAVPNCQHNLNGDKAEPSAFPTNIQTPSLCSQLTHLIGGQLNEKRTNQPPPT